MLENIIGAIAPGIIVGVVLFYWERRQKKSDTHTKQQTELQVEGDMLRLDLEVATAQLSYAVAMAVKRGHANGEMEAAIAKYETAMDKFRKFERKQMAMNSRVEEN